MLKEITGKINGGTCFLVNKNYALTVSHCVKGNNRGDIITVSFPNLNLDVEVELIKKLKTPLDFSILKLKEEAPNIDFIPLVNDVLLDGEMITSYGFPKGHLTHGRKINGKIIDSTLTMPTTDLKLDNYDLKIASQDIRNHRKEFIEGHSGSPLLIDNKIVGIVKNSLGDGFGVQKISNFIEHLEEYGIEYEELSTFREKIIEKALDEVESNKKSGKYIPGAHIEINEIKDKIRYFCDPLLFYKQIIEKIEKLDFSYLNSKLEQLNIPLVEFEIEKKECFQISEIIPEIIIIEEDLQKKIDYFNILESRELSKYYPDVNKKAYKIMEAKLVNRYFGNSNKIESILKKLSFFKSQILFILDTAGRGKTTLMCDFVENFLKNKKQLTLFIPAYKIIDGNWFNFLEREILKPQNIDFQSFLIKMNSIAEKDKKPALIIIDGLNENESHTNLSINLLSYMDNLKDYPYIKLILTSRKEYFKERFKSLEEIKDRDNISVIENVFRFRHNEILREKSIDKYLNHFDVNTRIRDKEVLNQLLSNPLLLRFFCEAYSGRTISEVHNLYKYDLFFEYTKNKSSTLKCRGYNENCFYSILDQASKYMVENNKYSEVPLENFENKELVQNIIIEDIVFREDLIVGQGRGGNIIKEVISFTFDEYRDYNLAWYLIENYTVEEVYTKIIDLVENVQPITEGVTKYIYFIAKLTDKRELFDKIKNMVWTIEPFLEFIFSIEDDKISKKDMRTLEVIFNYDSKYTQKIFTDLIRRRERTYQTLNTNVIFKLIKQMTAVEYIDKFLNVFIDKSRRYFYGERERESQISQITKEIKEKISSSNQELAYKLLLILAPTPNDYNPYYKTIDLLENLHKKLGSRAINIIQELKENNKNELLEVFLNRMEEKGKIGYFNSYSSNLSKIVNESNPHVISSIISDMDLKDVHNDIWDSFDFLKALEDIIIIEEE